MNPPPTLAPRLALHGAVAFTVLVLALHVLTPDLDPSWRFVSEYANGRFGWMMMLAFLALALSCAALFAVLRRQARGLTGRLGLALLLVVSLALVVAGLFAMDPITSTPEQLTTHGNLHGLASMVGVPGLPLAAVLIAWSLWRQPAWAAQRGALMAAALFSLLCLLAMFGYLAAAVPAAGGFGPTVQVGWFNRLLVLSYVVFLAVAARAARRTTTP